MTKALLLGMLLMVTGQYRPSGAVFQTSGSLNPCLLSAWPMNEGSGTTLFDHGPSANNQTVSSLPAWTTAVGFPGSVLGPSVPSDAGSATPTSALFTGTNSFTVTFWSNANTSAASQEWFDTTNILANPGLEIREGGVGDNKFEVILTSGIYPTGTAFLQSTYQPNGSLQYFSVVYTYTSGSPAASNFTMFVNGSPVSYSALINSLSSTVTSTQPLHLNTQIGTLAYVEIYNCDISSLLPTYYAAGPGIY